MRDRKELTLRWQGEESRIEAIIQDLKAGEDWTRNLKFDASSRRRKLPLVESCPTAALGGEEAPRDLRGIKLGSVDLSGVDGLTDSQLDFAVLDGVTIAQTALRGVSLRSASIRNGCMLDETDLSFSDLSDASISNSSLRNSKFVSSDLRGTDFGSSDLTGAVFRDAEIRTEGTLGFLWPFHRWTRFRGQEQDRQISKDSDTVFRRHVGDCCAAYRFRLANPILGTLSYLLTNFGRSPLRLLFWSFSVWIVFGILYSGLIGGHFQALDPILPEFMYSHSKETVARDIWTGLYLSLVTMTTLGLGDIVPVTGNLPAYSLICLEALLGYMFLGSFVSLLLQSFNGIRDLGP